jgi:hypothetical protein
MKKPKVLFWLLSLAVLLTSIVTSQIPVSANAASSSGNVQNLSVSTGPMGGSEVYGLDNYTSGIELCIPVSGANSSNQSKYSFSITSNAGTSTTIQKYDSSNNCFLTNKIPSSPSVTLDTTDGIIGLDPPTNCLAGMDKDKPQNVYTIRVRDGSYSAIASVNLCGLEYGMVHKTSSITLSSSNQQYVPKVTVDAVYTTPIGCTSSCTGTQKVPAYSQTGNTQACLVPYDTSNPSNTSKGCANGSITLTPTSDGVFVANDVPFSKHNDQYNIVLTYDADLGNAPYAVAASEATHTLNSTKDMTIPVTLTYALGGNPSPLPQQSTQTQGTATPPTCESSGFVISWIVCGAINLISSAENSIEGIIGNLLKTQPFVFNANANCTSNSTSCSNQKVSAAIYSVWSNFRTYGDIVLVIALLIVVFSEAAGGGLIDAYTVRKVLPRILAAAILINLSIYIIAGLEDIFNILGSGIVNLLEDPFKSAGSLTSHIHLSNSGALPFSLGLVGLAGLVVVLPGVIGILFMAVLAGFIAALGILVTIAIRQGLLVFLLIISPVAFALYVLPNTEKYFKKWWDLLVKTLAVYPIVMAVFGISFISGIIMSNLANNGNDKMLSESIAVLAVVAPLFLVPFAFKMSGGVIGAVQGAVSKLTSSANKPLKRAATRELGKGWNKTRNYNRFSDRNAVTRRINTMLGAATHPMRDLRRGRAGINAGRYTSTLAQGAAELKDDQTYQLHQNDDKFLVAMTNRQLAEDKLREAQAKYEAAAPNSDEKALYQAEIQARQNGLNLANQVKSRRSRGTQLMALQALARTGYQFSDGEAGYKELASSVRNIVGDDDAAYASAMNTAQYFLKEAGRYDLAGINDGAFYDPEAGLAKADPWTLGNRAKPPAIKAKGSLMMQALHSGNFEQAEVHRLELQSVAQNATGSNQKAALEALAKFDAELSKTNASTGNTYGNDRTKYLTTVVSTPPPSTATPPAPIPTRVDYIKGVTNISDWDRNDIARGYRMEMRPPPPPPQKTNYDVVRERARGWQRPNPSEL